MKFEIDVKPTIAQLAAAFTELPDIDQAQFFVEVGKIAATWAPAGATMQWHFVGRILAKQLCSPQFSEAYDAGQVVREIARAMDEE